MIPDSYEGHLRRRLVESHVPEHLHDGLVHYIAARRPVGQFLMAVLTNDLHKACAHADDICQVHLHSLVFFLYNYAPGTCWGSTKGVARWLTDPEPPIPVFE